jgi:hypothetical protein
MGCSNSCCRKKRNKYNKELRESVVGCISTKDLPDTVVSIHKIYIPCFILTLGVWFSSKFHVTEFQKQQNMALTEQTLQC